MSPKLFYKSLKKFHGNCLNCGRSDHWSWDCPESGNRDHHGHCAEEVFQIRKFSRGHGSPTGYRMHEKNGNVALHFMSFVQAKILCTFQKFVFCPAI